MITTDHTEDTEGEKNRMRTKRYIGIGIGILFLSLFPFLFFGFSGSSMAFPPQTTTVSVSPSYSIASFGETFTVNIAVDPTTAIAGVQFDLYFDPAIVTVSKIEEGNLLSQRGASTYFSPGTIDNTAGTITGVAGAITTPGETTSRNGTFAILYLKAGNIAGESPLNMSNVIVGDINGNPVPVTVINGTADPITIVNVSPTSQSVQKGDSFTVNVTVDPAVAIAGAQFDLHFNPALVSADSVTEGNLFNQNGASTYFSPGTIDNTAGTITGVAGVITTPGENVSSPGVFATIQMTAKSIDGTSTLDLSNVIVGDINGQPVAITVNNGSVTIGVSPTPTPTPTPEVTTVNVTPTTQTVSAGTPFSINVTVDPAVPIAGAQFDLHFNSALISANSITEGDLLKQDGASTYFSPGTINNTAGTITGVAGAITTPGATVSSPAVFATIQMTAKSVDGTSTLDLSNVIVGDINGQPVAITVNDGSVTVGEVDYYFDTGTGTYPSIMGTHTGTIRPNKMIVVHKMYTYPCAGTGGHTEYVRFYGTDLDVNKTWNGYIGDYHNITFDPPITLQANITYDYEIRTGSYPQIIHEQSLPTAKGTINCTLFTDANGRTYDNWIPAIRLE